MEDITVTVALNLKADAVEAFCAGMNENLKDTLKFPGFKSTRVVRHDTDPNRVLIIEIWESKAAYEKYVGWRAERGEMDAIAAIVSAPPVLEFWSKAVAAADKGSSAVGG